MLSNIQIALWYAQGTQGVRHGSVQAEVCGEQPRERGKSMSVMVTVEWPAKAEKLSEFLDVLKQALVDTRAYDGCESVQTYVENAASTVLLVEVWATEDHQKAYMKWRMETGLMDAVGGYLVSAPIARTFGIRSDV